MDWVLKAVVTEFNSGCSEMCVVQQGFSSSVCQALAGATQVSMTKLTSNDRRNGPDDVLQRVYQMMSFLPLN